MRVVRPILAYIVALLSGLFVMWFATPILLLFGVGGGYSGPALVLCFGTLASLPPFVAAKVLMRRWNWQGQAASMALGAIVAAFSVALLSLGFSGGLTHELLGVRTVLGVLLAGTCAGFVHHAVMSAERKTK